MTKTAKTNQATQADSPRKFNFISGLPRSGSTLLSAILRQNPHFHAGMTSPVATLFKSVITAVSAGSEHANRLRIVDYDKLVAAPAQVMAQIYKFLDHPHFAHDFDAVTYDAPGFDAQFGLKWLHSVHKKVAPLPRRTILPPEVFAHFAAMHFWDSLHTSEMRTSKIRTSGKNDPQVHEADQNGHQGQTPDKSQKTVSLVTEARPAAADDTGVGAAIQHKACA